MKKTQGWLILAVGFGLVAEISGCSLHPKATPSPSSTALPATFVADAATGQHLFVQNCTSCHSTGLIRLYGPGLQDVFLQKQLPNHLPVTVQNVEQWIYTGGGDMPSFAFLSAEDRANLTAYLQTLHK